MKKKEKKCGMPIASFVLNYGNFLMEFCMRVTQRVFWVAAMAVLALFAPASHAVQFSISGVAFLPGAGYGDDASETSSPTWLDVEFAVSLLFPQSFALNSVDASNTFTFGTVTFEEPSAGGGIDATEQDGLGVSAQFTFTDPLGATKDVLATGTATAGSVADTQNDFSIDWNDVLVSFGNGGEFRISMADLTFSGTGAQTQSATITLTQLPSDATGPVGAAPVPEPGSLALFGIALAGAACSRRKR